MIDVACITVLVGLVQIPGIIMRYIPFRIILKKEQNVLLLKYYSAVFIAELFVTYFVLREVGISVGVYKLLLFMNGAIYFLVNCIVIRNMLAKQLLVCCMAANYTLILHGFTMIPRAIFSASQSVSEEIVISCISYLLVFLITVYPLYKVFRQTIECFIINIRDYYWNTICIVPFLLFMSDIIFLLNNAWLDSWQLMLNRIITGAIILIMCKCMAHDYQKISEKSKIEEGIKKLKDNLSRYKEYYAASLLHVEEVKKAKHDLRQFKRAMLYFIENGDIDKLKKFYTEINAELGEFEFSPVTNNMALDSVLFYYWHICKKEKIKFNVTCNVKEDLGMEDIDLCILLGNSLENALEACRRLTKDDKFITLCAEIENDELVILVDNSYNGIHYRTEEAFLSQKRDNSIGIGINSIKYICDKYNGIYRFEATDEVFMANFILTLKK